MWKLLFLFILYFLKMGNIQESLRSHSEWILVENGPQLQGDPFHNHGGRQIKCDGLTPLGSKRSLPPVLPTMAGSNEQVCVCPRVLLWRWLGKHCHKSYHCSAIPPFRELFECPSYWAFSCKVVIFTDFTNYDRAHLFANCNKQNKYEKKTFIIYL